LRKTKLEKFGQRGKDRGGYVTIGEREKERTSKGGEDETGDESNCETKKCQRKGNSSKKNRVIGLE
jgi:hypothetical protein